LKKLQKLIEEATVDCYDREDGLASFHSTLIDEVSRPFNVRVMGTSAVVVGFREHKGVLSAVCLHKDKKYLVNLDSIQLVRPYPEGYVWIRAYLEWRASS